MRNPTHPVSTLARSALFSSLRAAARPLTLLSLVALGSIGCGALHAAVLADDQFIDGGFTDGADALDLSWTSISASTLSITPFSSTGNLSNALGYDATASFSTAKGAFNNSTALAIGESITVSFDFRITIAGGSDSAGLRFGLGNSSNTYAFTVGTGTSTGGNIAQFAANTVGGTNTGYTTTGTPLGINNTTAHTFSLTLTRATNNTLSFIANIDGSSFTASMSNTTSNFVFNSIIVGQGGTNNDFNIDNVLVTTTATAVPEPSTTALFIGAGILGAAIVARRRRKIL